MPDQTSEQVADLIRDSIRAHGDDAPLSAVNDVIAWPPLLLVSRTFTEMLASGEVVEYRDESGNPRVRLASIRGDNS